MTGKKTFFLLLLFITLTGLLSRLYGISEQPPLPDEVRVAFTAENYIEEGQFGPTMPNHPNLRNILVYLSMQVLGTDVFGLRGFSLLFGIFSIPLLGLLVFRITSNQTASCLAAFFLAIDPVHIAFSRQAIQEVHTAFFFLLGVYLVMACLRREQNNQSTVHPSGHDFAFSRPQVLLPLAGVSFGLGLASKGHALFPMIVCLLYSVYASLRSRQARGILLLVILSLGLLPLVVYLLTYLPWFARGYDLLDWLFMQKSLFVMTATHMGNPMDSMMDIMPGLWFIKPFMGYGMFAEFEGKPYVTIAMGNPLVWMVVIPSSIYLFFKGIPGRWILLALFLVSYLPLVFSPRPVWVLSSIAVTPFAYGITGVAVSEAGRRIGRKALGAYIALALLASVMLYPMAIGKAWDYDYLSPLAERLNPHEHEILKSGQENE